MAKEGVDQIAAELYTENDLTASPAERLPPSSTGGLRNDRLPPSRTGCLRNERLPPSRTDGLSNRRLHASRTDGLRIEKLIASRTDGLSNGKISASQTGGLRIGRLPPSRTDGLRNERLHASRTDGLSNDKIPASKTDVLRNNALHSHAHSNHHTSSDALTARQTCSDGHSNHHPSSDALTTRQTRSDLPIEDPACKKLESAIYFAQGDCFEAMKERKMRTDGEDMLIRAVRNADWTTVQALLSRGVNVAITDMDGNPLLNIACSSKRVPDGLRTIETLLLFGADPNSLNKQGLSPLHVTLQKSESPTSLVKLLLEAGSNPNARYTCEMTPLLQVCYYKSVDALAKMTILMDYKSNIFARDRRGISALHLLCAFSYLDLFVRDKMAVKLLMTGVSANSTITNTDTIPLMDAIDSLIWTPFDTETAEWDWTLVITLIQAGSKITFKSTTNKDWFKDIMHDVTDYPTFLPILLKLTWPTYSMEFLEVLPELSSMSDSHMFCKEIRRLSKIVRSLKDLSRIVVREALDGKVLLHAPSLPLPREIKDYITLSNS